MAGRGRWAWPRRIAHRGGGTLAPENTIAAISEGIARGYRAVEVDVMLTGDDVPVLMHDAVLGRTVGGPGRVADLSYAALSRCDAGGWFEARFAGEPVPRYEDAIAFCRRHGVWMNVEIKPSPGHEARTGRIVASITAAWFTVDAAGRPLLSSFSIAALDAARDAAPRIDRGLLVEAVDDGCLAIAASLECVSVHAGQRTLDASTIERVHAAGFGVAGYTVDAPQRVAELERAGIDALFVDRLDLVPPTRPEAPAQK